MDATVCRHLAEVRLDMGALQRTLADALGPDTGVACADVLGDPLQLWPAERAAIGRAVPRRQREFAAGRASARAALGQIGVPAQAIPSSPDRAPVWPAGTTGSIAHNARVCVAIAKRRTRCQSVGIDLEDEGAIEPALWEGICTPQELRLLSSLPRQEQSACVTRLFCAKEAYYKWQYPQTRQLLDFQAVEIALTSHASRFRARATNRAPLALPVCQQEGHFLSTQGLLLAWLTGAPA